jgi:predicted nucleic acid-binding protein
MPWIEAVKKGRLKGRMTWHSIAEAWAVLTRLPGQPLPAALAERILERLVKQLLPIPLGAAVYRGAIGRCSERSLSSGAIFDAIHLIAAERIGASLFVTFNVSDFERLTLDNSRPRIVLPPDPPEARW